MATAPLDELKICRKCNQAKPVGAYNRNKNFGDGLHRDCKECDRADQRARRKRNADKMRERDRAYYAANRDRKAETAKRRRARMTPAQKAEKTRKHADWRAANPEKVRANELRRLERIKANPDCRKKESERSAEWRRQSPKYAKWKEANREEHNAYYREWRGDNVERTRKLYRQKWNRTKANPDLLARNRERGRKWARENPEKQQARSALRRSRLANVEGTHSKSELLAIRAVQKQLCFYCEGPLEPCEFDHFIPISRGGSNWADNLVASCKACNASKNNKMPWEWQPHRFREGDLPR